jgi:solute carrier family 25 iron transporter 28/37
MNIPFTAVYFSTYESAKKALGAREAWQEETLRVQLLAGGLAGGTAAGLTTPLDVVKTRLQLAGVSSPTRYSSSALVRALRLRALRLRSISGRADPAAALGPLRSCPPCAAS